MNRSKIFKEAHRLTRRVSQRGDIYRVTFGASLKIKYQEAKKQKCFIKRLLGA